MKLLSFPSRPFLVPAFRTRFRHRNIIASWRDAPRRGQALDILDEFYDGVSNLRWAVFYSACALDIGWLFQSSRLFFLSAAASIVILWLGNLKKIHRSLFLWPTVRRIWKAYRELMSIPTFKRLHSRLHHDQACEVVDRILAECAHRDTQEGIFHGGDFNPPSVEEEKLSLTIRYSQLMSPFDLCKSWHVYRLRAKKTS